MTTANDLTHDIVSDIVGFRIKNLELYRCAFTHKSALKLSVAAKSYETLEFMGDSVLGFIISKYIFEKYSGEEEGFFTRARTRLVRGKTLAHIAKELKLNQYILMDSKGMAKGWMNNPKILEDVFESLVGAIYMDKGMLSTKKFVLDVYTKLDMFSDRVIKADDNYKDALMRACQKAKITLPIYKPIPGPPMGEKSFSLIVEVNGKDICSGRGNNKRDAEQDAARGALTRLNCNLMLRS